MITYRYNMRMCDNTQRNSVNQHFTNAGSCDFFARKFLDCDVVSFPNPTALQARPNLNRHVTLVNLKGRTLLKNTVNQDPPHSVLMKTYQTRTKRSTAEAGSSTSTKLPKCDSRRHAIRDKRADRNINRIANERHIDFVVRTKSKRLNTI